MEPILTCPHCGAHNALPFEDDSPSKSDATLTLILITSILLFIGYILLMISTYLFFPGVVFISIIITTRLINRREKEKKESIIIPRDYMCLDCGEFFRVPPPARGSS